MAHTHDSTNTCCLKMLLQARAAFLCCSCDGEAHLCECSVGELGRQDFQGICLVCCASGHTPGSIKQISLWSLTTEIPTVTEAYLQITLAGLEKFLQHLS